MAECNSCEVNFADAGQLIDTTLAFCKEDSLLSRAVKRYCAIIMLAVPEVEQSRFNRFTRGCVLTQDGGRIMYTLMKKTGLSGV